MSWGQYCTHCICWMQCKLKCFLPFHAAQLTDISLFICVYRSLGRIQFNLYQDQEEQNVFSHVIRQRSNYPCTTSIMNAEIYVCVPRYNKTSFFHMCVFVYTYEFNNNTIYVKLHITLVLLFNVYHVYSFSFSFLFYHKQLP